MPELWLPYGGVEVPLDIRAENLGELVDPRPPALEQDVLTARLQELGSQQRNLILLQDATPPLLTVLAQLLHLRPEKATVEQCAVAARPSQHASLRRLIEEAGAKLLSVRPSKRGPEERSESEHSGLPTEWAHYDRITLLSQARLDPLFGFSGGPVELLRLLSPGTMSRVYREALGDGPHPGRETPAFHVAQQFADGLPQVAGLEVVTHGDKVVDLFADGTISSAHGHATDRLKELYGAGFSGPTKAVICAPGRGSVQTTLAAALPALWNVLSIVQERGVVVVVAECAQGLGSEALHAAASGQIDLDGHLERRNYIEGMEHLVYLRNVRAKAKIILVSALPLFYLEARFGLRSARRVNDALAFVLSSLGSRVKVTVATSGVDLLPQLAAVA